MLKREENAEYVLNTEDPNFEEDLKNLSLKVIKTFNYIREYQLYDCIITFL